MRGECGGSAGEMGGGGMTRREVFHLRCCFIFWSGSILVMKELGFGWIWVLYATRALLRCRLDGWTNLLFPKPTLLQAAGVSHGPGWICSFLHRAKTNPQITSQNCILLVGFCR